MDPRAERQVRVRLAPEVELVGAIEDGRVSVGRAEEQAELGPLRDLVPVELERLEHPPLEHLQRRVVSKELVDRVRQQGAVLAQPLQVVGMTEQRPPPDEGRVHGRLVTGVEDEHARPDQLVLGQGLALVDDLGELGDEVVPRRPAPLPRQSAQVLGELGAGAHGILLGLVRRVQLVHLADVGRPRPKVDAVGLGDAQHLRDDRDRERFGDRREQVELAGAGDLVDE